MVERNSLRVQLNVSRGHIDVCQLFHSYWIRDETKCEGELQTTTTASVQYMHDVIMDPSCTESDIAQNDIENVRAAAITYHSMKNKLHILYRIASILGSSHVHVAHNKLDKLLIAISKSNTRRSSRETQFISSNNLSLTHIEPTMTEQIPHSTVQGTIHTKNSQVPASFVPEHAHLSQITGTDISLQSSVITEYFQQNNNTSHSFTQLSKNPQSTVGNISEIIEYIRSETIPLRGSRVRSRSLQDGSSKL